MARRKAQPEIIDNAPEYEHRHYELLPECGHDERYEIRWREETLAGRRARVSFCIACNYEIITKQIAQPQDEQEIGSGGM